MPDLRRALTTITVLGIRFERGIIVGAGSTVDLDSEVCPDRTLREFVDEAWFEVPCLTGLPTDEEY